MVPVLDRVEGVLAIEAVVFEDYPGVVGAGGAPFALFFEEAGYVGKVLAAGLFVGF